MRARHLAVFHSSCFSCCVCRRTLSRGQQFALVDAARIYCRADYERQRAARGLTTPAVAAAPPTPAGARVRYSPSTWVVMRSVGRFVCRHQRRIIQEVLDEVGRNFHGRYSRSFLDLSPSTCRLGNTATPQRPVLCDFVLSKSHIL